MPEQRRLRDGAGVSMVWDSTSLGFGAAFPSDKLGLAVACGPQNEALVAGAAARASYFPGTGWGSSTIGPFVGALASSPDGTQFVVGDINGVAHWVNLSLVDTPIPSPLDGGHITAVTWLDTVRFAVGDSSKGAVSFYATSMGGSTHLGTLTQPFPGYGRTLVVGDVTPANPGPELIVGADGKVLIMTLDSVSVVATLPGGPSFSTGLAIEHGAVVGNDGGTLDALWVGEPLTDRVFRYIGDDAGVFTPPTGSGGLSANGFGAAIAVTSQPTPQVFIGAPNYGNNFLGEGAVFKTSARAAVVSGRIVVCGPAAPCGPCESCFGGVVCTRLSTAQCVSVDAGILPDPGTDGGADASVAMDAGAPDAGSPDAGGADAGAADAGAANGDAGTPDAGLIDAGTGLPTDAGEERVDAGERGVDAGLLTDAQFTAQCGCSTPLAAPALLLGLLLTRRWRRQTIPARP